MTARSGNTIGALYMMGSMLAFLINDTLMKLILAEASLFQAITVRGAATTVLFFAFVVATRSARTRIGRRDRRLIAARSVVDAAATVSFVAGLFYLPIANATAILLALPLTVSLAGALFLGEPVGWRRLVAILLGFVGVLLIVQPGLAGFNVHSLFIVGCVLAVTVRELMTRQLSRQVPSVRVALAGVGTVTLAGLAGLLTERWQPLPLHTWIALAGAVAAVLAGYVFAIKAMRVGEIAVVTPYRYTSLVFALVSGALVFGDWPDNITLLGAAIIVATGIFTLVREGRAARARNTAPAAPSPGPPA